MPTAFINGINLYYELHGEGPPLVMIMGLGATLDWWDEIIVHRLSQRYRLLLFDNRGAGRTDKPRGRYTIRLFAEDTAALMTHVGIERAPVIGASMGGMIAQELAISYPHRVDKLVLVSTSCGGRPAALPSLRVIRLLLDQTGTPEERKDRQMQLLFPAGFLAESGERLERLWQRIKSRQFEPAAFWRQLGAIVTFRSYNRLPAIQVPTLVITGSEDVLVPPLNSEILAARIPGARLVVFEGAGHGLTSQFPERFCEVVEEFLEGEQAGS